MAKLPYIEWCVADYFKDTRCLSPAARGCWCDILGYLHQTNPRGIASMTVEDWAAKVVVTPEVMASCISELANFHVSNIKRLPNGKITVANRRMLREEKEKENNRIRQRRFQARRHANGSLTNFSQNPPPTSQRQNNAAPELAQDLPDSGATASDGTPSAILSLNLKKDSEKERKSRRGSVRGSVYPAHFEPNDRAHELAKSYGLNLYKELAAFRDHHVSVGTVFKDWQAALRTWLRRTVQYAKRGARS